MSRIDRALRTVLSNRRAGPGTFIIFLGAIVIGNALVPIGLASPSGTFRRLAYLTFASGVCLAFGWLALAVIGALLLRVRKIARARRITGQGPLPPSE